jgi:hypothetical protein
MSILGCSPDSDGEQANKTAKPFFKLQVALNLFTG